MNFMLLMTCILLIILGDVNIDGTQKINSPEVYNEWIVVVDFPADVSVNEMVQNFYKIASETLGR